MSRKSDFISLSRTSIKNLMAELDKIAALNREYTANGAAVWLDTADFAGANASVAATEFETAFGNAAALNTYVSTQNYDDTFFKVF